MAKKCHLPVTAQYPSRPMCAPRDEMRFRDKPVTVDTMPNGYKRIAVWMPGEVMQTQPLLQQSFKPDDFHEVVTQAAREAGKHAPSFSGQLLRPAEAFMAAWCEKNYNLILREEDRRSMHGTGWMDLGRFEPAKDLPTRSFRGEDGKDYVAIDAEKLRQEQAHRRQQEQLEAVPGFGSF